MIFHLHWSSFALYNKMGNCSGESTFTSLLYLFQPLYQTALLTFSQLDNDRGCEKLHAFEFIEVSDEVAAITIIKTKLIYEEDKCEVERVVDFRLINKGLDGSVAVRGKPNCSWMIYTFYV
jgi:hypothetical protein